jgi:hypothetical protein
MQPSIWESPTDVVSKGLFGGAQASQALKRGGAARKAEASRAAAAKVLASVDEGNKQQGPLPQVRLLETLNPQHAILDPRPSTLNPQPSTLNPRSCRRAAAGAPPGVLTAVDVRRECCESRKGLRARKEAMLRKRAVLNNKRHI